jgi:hypothetical protein
VWSIVVTSHPLNGIKSWKKQENFGIAAPLAKYCLP